jgi:hypothetical protein
MLNILKRTYMSWDVVAHGPPRDEVPLISSANRNPLINGLMKNQEISGMYLVSGIALAEVQDKISAL